MSTTSSTFKRSLQVYVEVPSFSWTTTHVQAARKENTPPGPSNSSIMPGIKRKLTEIDVAPSLPIDYNPHLHKKTKVLTDLTIARETDSSVEQFPNGSSYCHQCVKRRDALLVIQCTFNDPKTGTRCKAKYCQTCLKNRYGESTDDIKAGNVTITAGDIANYVSMEGFMFKCPRCRDMCNCARCRKAKGLGPTGNLLVLANRAGAGSAAALLLANPNVAGIMPGKGQQVEPIKKPRAPKRIASADSHNSGKATSHDTTPPVWLQLPTYLNLPNAVARIHVREFVLRFAAVLGIGKGWLEELENLTGVRATVKYYVADEDEEEEEMCDWISEGCVKSICLGLLTTIAHDVDGEMSKAIKSVIQEIRGASPNLTKLWSKLADLRISKASSRLSFPDPLPAPASATTRITRTTRTTTAVVHTAQMLPVMVALCDRVLECESIRGELENGVKEGREKAKEFREGVKKESERWEEEKLMLEDKSGEDETAKGAAEQKGKKKANVELKQKRTKHIQHIAALEQSLRIANFAYTPRFGSLGRDPNGRVYWALSPGVGEREAALEFLSTQSGAKKSGKSRAARGKRTVGEDERKEMKRWSWFIAVWGKRPDDADVRAVERKPLSEGSDEEDEPDDGQEKWWGFWEPEEIRRLAAFVDRTGGLVERDEARGENPGVQPEQVLSPVQPAPSEERPLPTKDELKGLVKGLREYADSLEWRIKRDGGDTDGTGAAESSANPE